MTLQAMFDSMQNRCTPLEGSASFEWSVKGRGFGHLRFYEEDGKLYCDNECMTKERVKQILCIMVDRSIFNDEELLK